MSTYTVTAERSGKWWVLQAVEAPGAISQVARLDQADVIKEAIAFVTGEPEAEIEIYVRPVLEQPVVTALTWATEYRAQAAEANRLAAIQSRLAAHLLAVAGLTMRDIGSILGVSYQRAQQLATAELPEDLRRYAEGEDVGKAVAYLHHTEPDSPHVVGDDFERLTGVRIVPAHSS